MSLFLRIRTNRLQYGLLYAVLLCALCCLCTGALAQTPVARALAWLNQQVQANGSLNHETESIATPFQSRAEVAFTLKLLASVPGPLANSVNAEVDDNTQYLARKLMVLPGNELATANYLTLLLQRQNFNGGFGGGLGYDSHPITTAWAVLALAQGNSGNNGEAIMAANRARAYLLAQIDVDGGLREVSDFNRIYLSGIALLALQTTADNSNDTAIKGLSAWLLQKQGANGDWLGDVFLSAHTFAALAPTVTDTSVRNAASQYLLSRQAPDGSWNQDPFVTALALRALSTQPGSIPGPAFASIRGQVVDSGTNIGLSAVTMTLTSLSTVPAKVVTTDSAGSFIINGVAAGSYTLTASRNGYANRAANVTTVAGQTSDLGILTMAQLKTTAIVRGQITAAGSSTPLAGAVVTLSGAASAATTTDANGRFEISNVTPGALGLSATLAGYQSASANATALGGQILIFSPTLYLNNQPKPSTMRYFGKVVAAGVSTPLAGVAVQVTGSGGNNAAQTTASGQFDLTMNPGTYAASFSLPGYSSVTHSLIGSAGTIIDGGTIALSPIIALSSIKGLVLNPANAAIVGATVQIVGSTTSATTSSDGRYSLANLSGTSFTVRVSAIGYNSQIVNLQLAGPADITQNFTLAPQVGDALAIGDLLVQPSTVGSAANVTVTTVISNRGSSTAAAVLQLEVSDSNNKVIGKGSAFDSADHVIGQVSLAGGQAMAVKLVWNSAQFPPGDYTLAVRLVEPGSITRATPQGNLIIQRATIVKVTGQAHFNGTITANPPVARAGTNTAIKLSATLQNDGNIALARQAYTLSAINTRDNTVAHTETVPGAATPVASLLTLKFTDWVPTVAADYRLELAAADPAMGKIIGTLFIGDAVRANYSVNKLVVPTGTQSVRGSIDITGQDVAAGSISDPLAPLIKVAVNKAVRFNYQIAVEETLSSRCLRCHVQSQALVGGELTRRLTDSAALTAQRDTILNVLTTFQQSNGALDGDPRIGQFEKSQSMLGMFALNAWHKSVEIISTIAKGSQFLVNTQSNDGQWYSDYPNGWWISPFATNGINVKNLVDASNSLKQAPGGSAVKYSETVLTGSGINGPTQLASDSSGNVYVVNYNWGQILLIKKDGTTQVYMDGLAYPTALVFDRNGVAYVSTYFGLYRRNSDGTATQLSTRSGSGLAIGPDGNLYMSSYWDNKISKITPLGEVSDYIVGGALSRPKGIAFTSTGDLLVANHDALNILRYHPDLTQDVVVEYTAYPPHNLQLTANGCFVTTDSGLTFYNNEWHGERLLYNAMGGVLVTQDGSVLVGNVSNNTIAKVTPIAIDTTQLLASIDSAVAKTTTWLLNDANAVGINHLALAQRLIGLNAAKKHYEGQGLAATVQAKMVTIGAQLRSVVNPDGGWGLQPGIDSDSLVTAQVGVALDSLNPSSSDPIVQNAVKWLLGQQRPDGTWFSENRIMVTPQATTTWVSIWLPIVLDRLGGVDTDLAVTFPANVQMANPDIAPTTVTANSDGSKTVLWHLIGVTSAGRKINYDLNLADMQANEVRPVSSDAHLTFKNGFTDGVVNSAIDIPRVAASAFLDLGVTTDKLTYPANTLVRITGQVSNTSATPSGGSVQFNLYAPDNTLITHLSTLRFADLAPAASTDLNLTWNTGTWAAGAGYAVKATLLNQTGQAVGTAQSQFAISGAGNSGFALSATIATDKQLYQPSETVRLSDRLNNLTVNAGLSDLQIVVTVNNPDGTVRFSKTENLPQLAANAFKDYGYTLALNFAAAGVYTARVAVSTTKDGLLAQATSQFTVASSATSGSGLSGKITALPDTVNQGETVALAFSASNAGNSALLNLPLTVEIIDPTSLTVITSFSSTQNLAVGASYNGAKSWIASASSSNTVVALLSASIGGKKLTLGQTNITLITAQSNLEITQQSAAWQNVLVFSRCKRTLDDLLGQCGATGTTPLPMDDPVAMAQCDLNRAVALDQYLTKAGVAHKLTTNGTDFLNGMRSGLYNTFWVSNGATSIRELPTAELRAAVMRGNGLLIDGLSEGRNNQLTLCGGVSYSGKFALADQPLSVLGGLFTPGNYRITALPVQLKAAVGSVVQAKLGPITNTSPGPADGIISALLGSGKSLTFGFDWADTLRTQGSDPRWLDVTQKSLAHVTPAAPGGNQYFANEVFTLATRIKNGGQSADLQIVQTLPPGAQIIATEPATQANAGASWRINLPANGESTLRLRLRVPSTPGSASISTAINRFKDNVGTPYKTLQYDLTVRGASEMLTQFSADITALNLTTPAQLAARVTILEELNRTRLALAANRRDEALRRLLTVQNRLTRIDSNGMQAAMMARLIAMVEAQSGK